MFHQTASERTIVPLDVGTKEVCMGTEIPNQPDVVADATHAAAADVANAATQRSSAEAEIERLIETDPALVPNGPSQFVVSARLLEDEELAALLEGLSPLLDGDDPLVAKDLGAVDSGSNGEAHDASSEVDHEPYPTPTGCGRRHPELSPLAWLFPNHAGAGRPARHQQGHDLRARRGAGKKARSAPRQAQGSLFGNRQ
jgi:hypothetical protein